MKKGSTDLTRGNIYSCIIKYSLPILASHLFQNLYNSVDSIVVGNYVGKTALAAVGASSDISALLTGFFTGLSTGAVVLFARFFGAKDNKKLHDSIHTALTFSLLIGAAMAILGIILAPALLGLIDCPDDVYPEALRYLRIYFVGVLFTAIYNTGAGVLRAVGDSMRPFIYLVVASIINIILDVVTVVYLDMGVAGVAIATIVSQMVSVCLVFGTLLRTRDVYRVAFRDFGMDKSLLREVVRLGIPAAIQSSILSLSNLFVLKYRNVFGSGAMAGSTAGSKVDKFIGMIGQSLGQAIAPYVSQNIGARKKERVDGGIKAVSLIALGCYVAVAGTIYLAAESLISLFTKDPEAIYYGVTMIKTLAPFYLLQNFMQINSNLVRGYGKSTAVMFLYLFGMVGCRQIYLAIAFKISRTINIVFMCYPVGWFFAALFVTLYYYINKKELNARAFGSETGKESN